MKTMRRIDQPLQFEQPLALKNSLLEIQQHYQQIVQHIELFNVKLEERRKQVADELLAQERAKQRLARQRTEDAVRRARGHQKPRFWWRQFMPPSDEPAQEEPTQGLPAKRRRNAPYRFNIASTKGAFYQH